jgi:hypothetical protein
VQLKKRKDTVPSFKQYVMMGPKHCAVVEMFYSVIELEIEAPDHDCQGPDCACNQKGKENNES